MSVSLLKIQPLVLSQRTLKNINKCCFSSSIRETISEKIKNINSDIIGDLEAEDTPRYEVEQKYETVELDKLRNKSRLSSNHRNIVHGRRPYDKSMHWSHETVWYKKRIMGRYGIEAAEVNPAIAWPTREEIEDRKEYERVLYPNSIQEIWKEIEETKREEKEQMKKREEEIDKVVANFEKWKVALNAKIEKKEAEVLEAKKKKERMLAEIREQFGYHVDTKDERFQEMLAQKEKDDKKRKKEEKKQKNAEKLMAYIAKQEEEMKARKAAEEEKLKTDLGENEIKIQSSENNKNDKTKK